MIDTFTWAPESYLIRFQTELLWWSWGLRVRQAGFLTQFQPRLFFNLAIVIWEDDKQIKECTDLAGVYLLGYFQNSNHPTTHPLCIVYVPCTISPYKSPASLHSHTQNDFVVCFNYNYAPSQWNSEIVKVQKLEKSRCYAMLVLHSTTNVQLTKSPKAHNQPVMSLLKDLENIVFFNVLDDFWELRYRGPIWPLKMDVSALFVHHLAIFFFNWCCLYYVYCPYTAFMLPSLLNEITIIEIHLCETFMWLNTGKERKTEKKEYGVIDRDSNTRYLHLN